MDYIFAKLKIRASENEKFRRVSATDELVYPEISECIENPLHYNSETLLDKDNCFMIQDFSTKSFCGTLIKNGFDSPDYDQLTADEFENVDYIFVKRNNDLLFQNISKSKCVIRKGIIHTGEDFIYKSDNRTLLINYYPDAVYISASDTLYFSKLEAITSIFKGISELYREATNKETEAFLNREFIALENDFSAHKVKTLNRKRIAIAIDTLSTLNETDKNNIFEYITDYCPTLNYQNDRFTIGNEKELKDLLYGIEQRFYTTPVGNERRLANSVIKPNQENRQNDQTQNAHPEQG